MKYQKYGLFILSLFLFSSLWAAAPAPKVVVTISPIYALTQGVMQGVGLPILLVAPGASPHNYALKPSQVQDLNSANLVIWLGESLETFLIKTLAGLPKSTQKLSLLTTPHLDPLPMRISPTFGGTDHAHADHHGFDPHVWLDPVRSHLLVSAIAQALSQVDPENTARYQANAIQIKQQLDQLDQQLLNTLMPLRDKPFIVFHDAYQYLEKRYGLDIVAAITLNPEIMPSARHVAAIQQIIEQKKVICIFAEPQFKPAIVDMIAQGTGVREGVLDPESVTGVGFAAYAHLLTGLSTALQSCLS